LGDAPEPRQPPFGVGISGVPALSAQLWISGTFRLAAFASWFFLLPLRNSASLAVSLLEVSTALQTSLGLSCSACARCNWGGCLLCCGDWVSVSCDSSAHRSPCPVHHRMSRCGDPTSRSLIKGSFAFILPVFPWPGRFFRLEASLDVTPRFPPHRYQ